MRLQNQVQPALVETLCRYRKDLEIIFNVIDKDHSGKSRQLHCTSSGKCIQVIFPHRVPSLRLLNIEEPAVISFFQFRED